MTKAHATEDRPVVLQIGGGEEQSDTYRAPANGEDRGPERREPVVRIVDADQPEPAPVLDSQCSEVGGRPGGRVKREGGSTTRCVETRSSAFPERSAASEPV